MKIDYYFLGVCVSFASIYCFRMNPPLVSAFMHELIKLRNTDNEEKDLQKATKTATSANEWNFTHNELNQLKDQMRKVTVSFSYNCKLFYIKITYDF